MDAVRGFTPYLVARPNEWPRWKVDHNLRQLRDSRAYDVSTFDPKSIMKYHFAAWMFHSTASHCYTPTRNNDLSPSDMVGAKAAYPDAPPAIAEDIRVKEQIFHGLLAMPRLPDADKKAFNGQLDSIRTHYVK